MAVPPLLDLPTSACIANVSMSLSRVVGVTVSPFTLEEQAFKWPGEAWSMEFAMPPFTSRAIAEDWISFALSLEGKYGRFLAGDPSAKQARGVATGAPKINGGNQTGKILQTTDWTPNVTGIMLKGDYFQTGTGVSAKLYKLAADANSNGSGNATLQLVNSLKNSPPDGESIIVNNPRGVFRLVDNTYSWSVAPGGIYRLNFSAVEVV